MPCQSGCSQHHEDGNSLGRSLISLATPADHARVGLVSRGKPWNGIRSLCTKWNPIPVHETESDPCALGSRPCSGGPASVGILLCSPARAARGLHSTRSSGVLGGWRRGGTECHPPEFIRIRMNSTRRMSRGEAARRVGPRGPGAAPVGPRGPARAACRPLRAPPG